MTLTVARLLVQTCSTLPATDAGWTTQPYLRMIAGGDGAGQYLGQVQLAQDIGELQMPGTAAFSAVGAVPDVGRSGSGQTLDGLVVRILQEAAGGAVQIGNLRFNAIWHGVIRGEATRPDGAEDILGGAVCWTGVELPAVLGELALRRGWVKNGSAVTDPGYLPPFNGLRNGDRSAATMSVGFETVYVHDLSDITSGVGWTARQILDLLLAGGARPIVRPYGDFPQGWRWVISDPGNALAYVPDTLDLDGYSVLDAINVLINQRRGLTWYYTVSGSTVTINVHTTVSEAITAGSFTLPASSKTATLDLRGHETRGDAEFDRDSAGVFDIVEMRAAHPWVGITLCFDGTSEGSLQKDWSPALEATWATNPRRSGTERVHRRYKVRADWDGGQWETPSKGLRDSLGIGSSGDYGTGGYDGSREYSAGGSSVVPATVIRPERVLPCSDGFLSLRLDALQPPVVVYFDGTDYHDVSQRYQVQVDGPPLTVTIEDGRNGQEIAALMTVPGAKLLVTVGLRETQPLRVSWQRPQAEWPRRTPRIKVIPVPNAEQWIVLGGTVIGADPETGALLTMVDDLVVRDDLTSLKHALALARAWWTDAGVTVRWVERGTLDAGSTFRPGTLLTAITTANGTIEPDVVVTRRRWVRVEHDGAPSWDTVYETELAFPDFEAVL